MVYENLGRARQPIFFQSAFLPTTSSATLSVLTLQKCSRWLSISIVNSPTSSTSSVTRSDWPMCGSRSRRTMAFLRCPMRSRSCTFPPPISARKNWRQIQQRNHCKVFSRSSRNLRQVDYPLAWLDQDAFAAAHVREHDAEAAVGEAMKQAGLRDYYTKSQLAEGEVPNTPLGRKYLNSYSP